MNNYKKLYLSEIKQSCIGLLFLFILGIPAYLVIHPQGSLNYQHLFAPLGFGVVLAGLTDLFVVKKLLTPLRDLPDPEHFQVSCRKNQEALIYIKKLPLLFFLRILLVHTLCIAIIPGVTMFYMASGGHVFTPSEALILIILNIYLCASHSLLKIFLTENLTRRFFLAYFQFDKMDQLFSTRIARGFTLKQKIMFSYILLAVVPLIVIAGVSWYKLDVSDKEKAGNNLAANAQDIAMTGLSFIQQNNYQYLRMMAPHFNRHLILINNQGGILYSNISDIPLNTVEILQQTRQHPEGWLYLPGKKLLLGFAWTKENQALIVQAVYTKEVVGSSNNIQIVIALLAAMGIICATAIGYFFSGYLSRSVHLLDTGMGKIQSGDFTTRVHFTGTDEFSYLALGFNDMAQGLANRETVINELTFGLEQKVKDRTRELEEAIKQLQMTHKIIQEELVLARRVQQSFLPARVPLLPGWSITAKATPAREVGGDLYDFIPLQDNLLGIAVGDVTGKGMPAALMMVVGMGALHNATKGKVTPGETLNLLNRLLIPLMPPRMFLTLTYVILDPANKCCRIANAGGPLPLLFSPAEKKVRYLDVCGLPLGVFEDSTYEEITISLASGEILFFYSDGLVEATNDQGEFWGFERFEELVKTAPIELNEAVAYLQNTLDIFTGSSDQYDDITLVALQGQVANGGETN